MNCVPPVMIRGDKNCIWRILKQERDGGKEIIERYIQNKGSRFTFQLMVTSNLGEVTTPQGKIRRPKQKETDELTT